MNFHAKSGVCSSKNGRVIALGTKEDISGWRRWWRRRSTFSSVDNTVQTLKFVVRKFGQYTKFHMKSIHPSDNIKLTKLVNEDKDKKSKQNEAMRKNINNNDTQLTLKHMFDKKRNMSQTTLSKSSSMMKIFQVLVLLKLKSFEIYLKLLILR